MLRDPVTHWLATSFVWLAVLSAVTQILCHLRNYTEPLYQRYIIRIIFMVPFYAVTSWLSLLYREQSIYFDTPRDCYEAWVIYNFLSLCMAYVGGPGAVVVKSDGKVIQPSWLLMTCCWPPIKVDGFLLRKCKQGTLQFVIAKPILAAFTLLLFGAGLYKDSDWSPKHGYLYIAIIYNTCYSIALYYLLIFYVGCEELLEPFRPLLKIILIKTVIFLTFWQGIAVSMFSSGFKDETDAAALQDFMVCLEMLMSAGMMWVAFPHTEYKIGGQTQGWRLSAFAHAISLQDVYSDIMHQFNPNYKTYLLYSDGGPSDNVKRKKYRKQDKKSMQKTVSKHRKKHMSSDGAAPAEGDGEGEEWQPSQGSRGGKKLFKWVPGIRESERRQAVLVDSDSDAEYDEDNAHDNQLDHTMLASSDSEEDGRLPRPQSGASDSEASVASSARGRGQRRTSGAGMQQGGDVEMGVKRRSANGMEGGGGPKALLRIASIKRRIEEGLVLEDSDDDDRML